MTETATQRIQQGEPQHSPTENEYGTMTERARQAHRIVDTHVLLSMGVGFLPIPVLDIAGVTAVQLRMLKQLARHYDVPFSRHLGKELIGTLLGSVIPSSLTTTVGSAVKAVPVVGTVMGSLSMPLFAGAATYALGNIFIQHFETGGTLLSFNPARFREHFRQQFNRGRERVSESHEATAPGHGTPVE